MGLYDFKPQFVDAILAGEKNHTIRATRKYRDKPGKTMHLYCGLRTKQRRLLKRVKCVLVQEIRLEEQNGKFLAWIDGDLLAEDEMNRFFQQDGFPDGAKAAALFWRGRLPFVGHIYHWEISK